MKPGEKIHEGRQTEREQGERGWGNKGEIKQAADNTERESDQMLNKDGYEILRCFFFFNPHNKLDSAHNRETLYLETEHNNSNT